MLSIYLEPWSNFKSVMAKRFCKLRDVCVGRWYVNRGASCTRTDSLLNSDFSSINNNSSMYAWMMNTVWFKASWATLSKVYLLKNTFGDLSPKSLQFWRVYAAHITWGDSDTELYPKCDFLTCTTHRDLIWVRNPDENGAESSRKHHATLVPCTAEISPSLLDDERN